MKIAIDVAGFSAADSDGFRRAMGTWRSRKEMEKLHARLRGRLRGRQRPARAEQAEELFAKVAGFASFGFNKSHAAAFARTAYESAFLKLFYPAQFVTGLINAQPMGFYPVEVLINDAKRHGVRGAAGGRQPQPLPDDAPSGSGMPGRATSRGRGIDRRPERGALAGVRRARSATTRERWRGDGGARLRHPPRPAPGQGHRRGARASSSTRRSSAAGRIRSLADLVARTELSEEVVERLIRAGALDSLGRPRRELLWQLREVAARGPRSTDGRVSQARGRPAGPATAAHRGTRPAATLGAGTAGRQLRHPLARRPAPGRRAVPAGARPAGRGDQRGARRTRPPGRVADRRAGGDPAAPDDRQGHGLPGARGRDRHGQRHALAGRLGASCAAWSAATRCSTSKATLQREANVVNLVAREIRPLPDLARGVGGPSRPEGVRQLGHAGMRRLG